MKEMIGYCGYNCHLCAARSDDPAVRQKLVDGWRRVLGHTNYTVDNVQCDGCLSDGACADKGCQVRPCARQRLLPSCALCPDFACEKLKRLMASRAGLILYSFPRSASLTHAEYDLCLRQFESMPNLLRIMVDTGRLPSWAAQHRGEEDS